MGFRDSRAVLKAFKSLNPIDLGSTVVEFKIRTSKQENEEHNLT